MLCPRNRAGSKHKLGDQTQPVWRQGIQYRGDLQFSCCYTFTICSLSNTANISSPLHPKVQTTSVLYSLRSNWQSSVWDVGNNKSFPTRLVLQETYAEANNLSVSFHENFKEKNNDTAKRDNSPCLQVASCRHILYHSESVCLTLVCIKVHTVKNRAVTKMLIFCRLGRIILRSAYQQQTTPRNQTCGCSCSGDHYGKALHQQQQCGGHKPAVCVCVCVCVCVIC